MARRQYNITGANPAGGDQSPATALTRLRNLEAVDRFTGVNLVDGGDTVGGVAFTSDTVTVTSANSITTPGNYVFFNKTITMGTGGTIHAAANGVHLYFVNCFIVYSANSGLNSSIGPAANSDAVAGTDARVAQGAAATRSVNYYGCSISAFSLTFRMHVSDIINSSLNAYSSTPALINFGAGGGSRLLNTTTSGPSGHAAGCIITYYGAPDLFEGFRGSFTNLEAPAAFGANQAILVEPNFTSLQAAQRYRMQAAGIPDRCYQAIGPFNPPNNNPLVAGTNADILSGSGTPYVWQAGANTGGVINYYGWQPGFFEDIAQTVGIEGVNVRVETSATLDTTTLNTETAADFDAGIGNQSGTVVDLTGEDLDHIVDYKTAGTGLAVVGANTQMATNGTTFTAGQWIDWLRLGVFNAAGYTTAPTTETAQNFLGQAAPDGCVIAPLSLVRNSSYNQFNTRFRARSYSHDVEVTDVQNGTVGTAAGNQTANVLSPIDNTQYISSNLIGTRIKNDNVNADNTGNFDTFTATSTVSLNDIGNALRALWANYEVNANQGTTLQTGNFDETTYPTRIHIRTAAETGNNEWQETWGGARVASAGSGGQIRIAVLGNGIAGKDDDLYASLPGARTYNFAGLPLSDVPLQAQERLARIGNVHNVTLESGLDSAGPSGANDFYDIQFETDSTTITGLTTLSPGVNRAATQAVINLPTVVGDSDSDVTLTRGRITQTFSSGATVGVEGIRAGSDWTNFTTSSDVTATTIHGDFTVRGGSHSFTVANAPTTAASDSFTWTFAGSPTLDITLPTTAPTGLVTINTANQAGDESQYDIVKAWLDGITGLSYNNERLDETAPTSGYWLVAPPLAPAEPRTFTIAPPLANDTNTTLQNAIAAGGSFVYELDGTVTSHHISSATTLDDLTITTNNEADEDYNIWYKPLSYVDGNDSIIFDYNHTTWNPSNEASGSIGIFQPDPNGAVTGTATFDSTTTGVITFGTPVRTGTALSVTLTSASDDSGAVQSFGWAVANSSQYMEYVAANVYTNASTRPIQFDKSGTGATTAFAANITLRSTTGQRFLNGADGFTTQEAGTAPNTFPEVRGSATNVIFGSDAQISALAGGDAITELGNELKANQEANATSIRRASLLQPASGTIPNTSN